MLATGLHSVAAPARVVPTALPFAFLWTREYPGTPPITAAVSDGGWLVAGFADHLEMVSLATGEPVGTLPLPAPRLDCDAVICVVADDDFVRAVELTKRTVRWQKAAPGPLAFAPTLRSGWVFLTTKDGHIAALRDTDGVEVWRFDAKSPLTGPVSIDGDRMAIATADATLTMLDLRTGRAIRRTEIFSGTPGSPRLGGGVVYLGTENRDLLFIDATSGKPTGAPQRPGATVVGAPALDEHLIYTIGQDGVLNAFERGNGALKWHAELPTRPALVGPIVTDHLVIVGLRTGAFQIFLADGDGKKPAASIAAPGTADNPFRLQVPPMVAGSGRATRLVTVSVDVGDSSKWSAAVTAAAAKLPISDLPATIPGLALKLTDPSKPPVPR